jgi:benzodiazapine receptor
VTSIAICLAAGGLGSIATSAKITTWYATLAKPTWNPPNWVFAPVWTTLYVMMAVAAWFIWTRRDQPGARLALGLFGVQLALNTLWSFLFFGMENPGAAMFEIVLLWIALVATIAAFREISPVAAWLLTPYLLWVSFASCLNFAIWRLN